MTTIELESKVYRIGRCHATVYLSDGNCLEDVEVVSICGGATPTLWLSKGEDDVFLPVERVDRIESI